MKRTITIVALAVVAMAIVTEAKPWKSKGHAKGFWKKFFCSHWFHWPWISDDSAFSTERISQMRTLVGSCTADVGTCPVGSCSTKSYINFYDCPDNGYICPETVTQTADCGVFGVRKYQYVSRCGCCKDFGINVTGTVVDSVTNLPLQEMRIKFDKKFATNTDAGGRFKSTVDSDTRSVVIRARDKKKMYMDAVKIVDIPEGFQGPVKVELLMIKKALPVEIDSAVESTLSLSDDPLNSNAGNAFVVISPDSFKDRRGKPYNGPVNASVTFIDTNSDPEALIPGRFLTTVGNILENMISDGIVAFDFKDADGNELRAGPIKFTVREGMRIWDLNTANGLWEPAEVLPVRRRRQVVLTEEFLIKVSSGRWYNIDKIPGAPRCYFKARIFNETSGDEITNSTISSFRPEIIAYTSQNQRLRLYAGSTGAPNETCFEIRCPSVDNPDDALAGFINMTSTEIVSVGGAYLPSITYLTPKEFLQYDVAIKSKLEDVQYEIAPNDLDMFVNFVSYSAGPLYKDRSTCESSTVNQPAFHFFKSEPPSYEPVPTDTEICTARIAFRDNWNFYNYTSGLTTLPNVTGISVWEQNGLSFYYTDTAVMQISSEGGDDFVFICLKYRCSPSNNDESVTETTVYLDINIPNITYSYNYTDRNGTLVNQSYSMPEYYCYGKCVGPLCKRQVQNVNGTSIDGSFIAPDNVGSGPDFYDSVTSDCEDRSGSEPFAYQFYCHSNDENTREGSGENTRLPM